MHEMHTAVVVIARTALGQAGGGTHTLSPCHFPRIRGRRECSQQARWITAKAKLSTKHHRQRQRILRWTLSAAP